MFLDVSTRVEPCPLRWWKARETSWSRQDASKVIDEYQFGRPLCVSTHIIRCLEGPSRFLKGHHVSDTEARALQKISIKPLRWRDPSAQLQEERPSPKKSKPRFTHGDKSIMDETAYLVHLTAILCSHLRHVRPSHDPEHGRVMD